MTTIFAALALGFLGSFHCMGMCGPIALALPIGGRSAAAKFTAIFTYNLGRIVTYASLGFLFGIIGRGASIAGIQQILSITMGGIIISMVLLPARITSRLEYTTNRIPYMPAVKGAISALFKKRTLSSFFSIGLLNGLLPCGFVYIGLAGAIATGTAPTGALFMIAFGMGTVPAMMLVAFSSQLISLPMRMRIRRVIPVFVLFIGIVLIVRGLNLGLPYLSPKFDDKGQIKHSCCHRPQSQM